MGCVLASGEGFRKPRARDKGRRRMCDEFADLSIIRGALAKEWAEPDVAAIEYVLSGDAPKDWIGLFEEAYGPFHPAERLAGRRLRLLLDISSAPGVSLVPAMKERVDRAVRAANG